ncbi:hypothetical protein E2320_020061, partial [Naja naja]
GAFSVSSRVISASRERLRGRSPKIQLPEATPPSSSRRWVSFMNNQKQQKPTLSGQRFKTRKR